MFRRCHDASPSLRTHVAHVPRTTQLRKEQRTSQTVKEVISRSKKAPTEVVDVVIPDPGARDVVVAIKACGVCHTDLAYREGGINDEYPFLLGHEAAGVVESVGSDVTHVEVGDVVVLNWREAVSCL